MVDLVGGQQVINHGVLPGGIMGAGEQVILFSQCYRADAVLDHVAEKEIEITGYKRFHFFAASAPPRF